jgi:flagellar biosynthesis protein FlhF
MYLKLFRGAGMAETMAQVRMDLGADALILNSRRVSCGVEITAAVEPISEPAFLESDRFAALARHGVPSGLHSALLHGDLEVAIAQILRFGPLPLSPHERPLMLAGPPGAGKTLTTARLATRMVMSGIAPTVITTDGKRAGATEQLAAFTRLLKVPLLVASTPESLIRALTQRRDGAPVLIDTAGSEPREADHAEELKGLAIATNAHIALVLPAGLDPGEAAELAVAHAECGATYLIATRLDLARRLGGVIAAAAASHLFLAEAGIGPGAADGLVPFTPSILAAGLRHFGDKKNA